MRVLFNDVDEFLTELERERESVKRRIVRVTHLLRSLPGLAVTSMSVVATFECKGDVVRFESRVGHLWGVEHQDEPVKARAEATRAAIDAACERLGLEVRPGVLEHDHDTIPPAAAEERR